MKKTLFLVVVMTIGLWASSSVQVYSAQTFIEQVLRESLTLKQSQLNVQKQQSSLTHQNVWENPNLAVGFDDRLGGSMELTSAEFSQKLPTYKAESYKKGKNQARLDKAVQLQKQNQLELTYQAATLYYQLYYAQKNLDILAYQHKEIDQLLHIAKVREDSGDISSVIVSRIALKKAQLLQDKKDIQIQTQKLQYQAQYLLQIDRTIKIDGHLPHLEVISIDIENNREVLATKLDIKVAEYALFSEKSKRFLLPELYAYQEREQGIKNQTEDIYGVGLRFSLPFWNQNRADIEHAKLLKQQASFLHQQTQREIYNNWRQQKVSYEQSIQQVKDYKKQILVPSKQFYATQKLLFESGENSLLELLDGQALYFNATAKYNTLEAIRDISHLRTMQASSIDLLKDIK